MPCFCHYDPPEESKQKIKQLCQALIDEVKKLDKDGDPFGFDMMSLHRLLDHLYYPETCKERHGMD